MDTSGNMVDVGARLIDFERILASADVAGFDYGFVEHDQPRAPLQTVTASLGAANTWHRGYGGLKKYSSSWCPILSAIKIAAF